MPTSIPQLNIAKSLVMNTVRGMANFGVTLRNTKSNKTSYRDIT
jgi:hypothetical protein